MTVEVMVHKQPSFALQIICNVLSGLGKLSLPACHVDQSKVGVSYFGSLQGNVPNIALQMSQCSSLV